MRISLINLFFLLLASCDNNRFDNAEKMYLKINYNSNWDMICYFHPYSNVNEFFEANKLDVQHIKVNTDSDGFNYVLLFMGGEMQHSYAVSRRDGDFGLDEDKCFKRNQKLPKQLPRNNN